MTENNKFTPPAKEPGHVWDGWQVPLESTGQQPKQDDGRGVAKRLFDGGMGRTRSKDKR